MDEQDALPVETTSAETEPAVTAPAETDADPVEFEIKVREQDGIVVMDMGAGDIVRMRKSYAYDLAKKLMKAARV